MRPAGAAFGPTRELTRPARYHATDAVGAFVADDGRALVAWPTEASAGPGLAPGLHAARWDGERFAAPFALTAGELDIWADPTIVARGDGTPLVHWTEATGTTAVAFPFE